MRIRNEADGSGGGTSGSNLFVLWPTSSSICTQHRDTQGIVSSVFEKEEEGHGFYRRKGIVLSGKRLEEGYGGEVSDGRDGIDAGDVEEVGVVVQKGKEESAYREDLRIESQDDCEELGGALKGRR